VPDIHQTSPHWLPELDGLRCVAALTVAVVHYTPVTAPATSWLVWFRTIGGDYALANLSVAFFYGLSAFLLTYLELTRHDKSRRGLLRFYARRVFRIWPLYFFILGLGLLLAKPGVFEPFASDGIPEAHAWSLDYIWTFVTFTSNWTLALSGMGVFLDRGLSNLHILWSIAVEEQFYLVFPAAFWWCQRSRHPWRLLAMILATGMIFRMGWIWAGHASSEAGKGGAIYYASASYIEIFAAGAIAAVAAVRTPQQSHLRLALAHPVAGAAILGALLGVGWIWRSYLFPPYAPALIGSARVIEWLIAAAIYPIVGILVGVTLLRLYWRPDGMAARLLRSRPLRALGTLSFGIYVWHPLVQPVVRALDRRFVSSLPADVQSTAAGLLFFCYVALCVAAASVTYLLIEAPFLGWKDRLWTGRTHHSLAAGRPTPGLALPLALGIAAVTAIAIAKPAPAGTTAVSTAPRPTWDKVFRVAQPPSLGMQWMAMKAHRFDLEIIEMNGNQRPETRIVGAPGTNVSYGIPAKLGSSYIVRLRACATGGCSEWSEPAMIGSAGVERLP
jgi:peptidoglycan/LPS O-acetylase OafA/YrhL